MDSGLRLILGKAFRETAITVASSAAVVFIIYLMGFMMRTPFSFAVVFSFFVATVVYFTLVYDSLGIIYGRYRHMTVLLVLLAVLPIACQLVVIRYLLTSADKKYATIVLTGDLVFTALFAFATHYQAICINYRRGKLRNSIR